MKKYLPLLALGLLTISGLALRTSQPENLQGNAVDSVQLAAQATTIEYEAGTTAQAIDSGLFNNLADTLVNDGATLAELGYDLSTYCENEIGEYDGTNEYVEAAWLAAYEACYNMEAAEEAQDGAYNAYRDAATAADNSDRDSAGTAYEISQAYADDAAGYASDARDAADEAQDAADSIGGVDIDIVDTGGVDPISPDILDTTEVIDRDLDGIDIPVEVYTGYYEWYDNLDTWEPDVTVGVEDYTTLAEEFYADILSSADLAEFNTGGDYYDFMVTIFAESMETNSTYAEGAIQNAYTNGTLGATQFETYTNVNMELNNSFQNIQYFR